MFDEHQGMQSPQEHGVHVQEIDCDDPGGLCVQELPPARARAPRRRIDARGMQDRHPVDGATVTPSFMSSPWILSACIWAGLLPTWTAVLPAK
jgi:hypothetical protein